MKRDTRGMVDVETMRQVAQAARERIEAQPGSQDLGDCLDVVYTAGVADALAWAAGDGPLPVAFRAESLA